jgi:hypothetical protein
MNVMRAVERVLGWAQRDPDLPPDFPRDPYAKKPVPRTPRPDLRAGSVAVAEPDD